MALVINGVNNSITKVSLVKTTTVDSIKLTEVSPNHYSHSWDLEENTYCCKFSATLDSIDFSCIVVDGETVDMKDGGSGENIGVSVKIEDGKFTLTAGTDWGTALTFTNLKIEQYNGLADSNTIKGSLVVLGKLHVKSISVGGK